MRNKAMRFSKAAGVILSAVLIMTAGTPVQSRAASEATTASVQQSSALQPVALQLTGKKIVYLDTINGSDTYDGTSEEKAQKSLTQAEEQLSGGGVLVLVGDTVLSDADKETLPAQIQCMTEAQWNQEIAAGAGIAGQPGTSSGSLAAAGIGAAGTQTVTGGTTGAGSTGTSGTQTNTGSAGTTGTQTNTGSAGTTGTQTNAGGTGTTGTQTSAGSTVTIGTQTNAGGTVTTDTQPGAGSTGTTGSQPDTGSAGTTGTQPPAGAGSTGTTGSQTNAESAGTTGTQPPADTGSTGTTGIQPPADTGNTGTTGTQPPANAESAGTTGTQTPVDAGNAGTTGNRTVTGTAGTAGVQTAAGAKSAGVPDTQTGTQGTAQSGMNETSAGDGQNTDGSLPVSAGMEVAPADAGSGTNTGAGPVAPSADPALSAAKETTQGVNPAAPAAGAAGRFGAVRSGNPDLVAVIRHFIKLYAPAQPGDRAQSGEPDGTWAAGTASATQTPAVLLKKSVSAGKTSAKPVSTAASGPFGNPIVGDPGDFYKDDQSAGGTNQTAGSANQSAGNADQTVGTTNSAAGSANPAGTAGASATEGAKSQTSGAQTPPTDTSASGAQTSPADTSASETSGTASASQPDGAKRAPAALPVRKASAVSVDTGDDNRILPLSFTAVLSALFGGALFAGRRKRRTGEERE